MSDYSPLSPEQLAALSDAQKEFFQQLDAKDRQFYASHFSPTSLGEALDRKREIMQSRARLDAFDQKVKQNLAASANQQADKPGLSAGDVAAGAAGAAGLVGLGVLARQIAPEGKAEWRGVSPRDLVEPLVSAFARQENTDIRFEAPSEQGVRQAILLLRTPKGLLPGLVIVLAPLEQGVQVQIGKLTNEGVMETLKEGGLKLIDLLQGGLRAKRSGDLHDLLDLAGRVVGEGVDIAQIVRDLDLEDRAWEAIKNAADPLQAIYDQKMEIEEEARLKLEMIWDDYYYCPKCRVEFGADDLECRVCGAARPEKPEQPDPRKTI
ncbi:MAG: hypothetical protein JXA78_03300 [Anaerolineales bacterium]|nr:hypothetical protein [Anaerolineales bacterium]